MKLNDAVHKPNTRNKMNLTFNQDKDLSVKSCKKIVLTTDVIHLQAKIHYYCRENFYCHMEAAADEGLKKFSNDSVLKFYRAYAMLLQGKLIFLVMFA